MKLGILFFTLSIVVSIILLNPEIKKITASFLLNSERQVLSGLDYHVEESRYKILKVLDSKGLHVEIYRINNEEMTLVDAKPLTDKKDAYYKFGESKHNLFLKDINNDGSSEIILPSLDKNMKARLNVYIFDSNSESLQKVTQH